MERRFGAEAPNCLHVADNHLRAHGQRLVRLHGVRQTHRRLAVRHSDHGMQCISLVYTTRVREFRRLPSTGTVGDSYDNTMAESVNGAYKTELVWRRKPFQDLRDLELATFRWASWWNSKRPHQSLGFVECIDHAVLQGLLVYDVTIVYVVV